MSDLFGFSVPAPGPVSRGSDDVRTGDAGELLVLMKLMKWGYDAFQVNRGGSYDLGVDVAGRFVRIQVKTKSAATGGSWGYTLQRGFHGSKSGQFAYGAGDFDVAAFVALSIERVLFVPGVVDRWSARTEQFLGEHAELNSWRVALNELNKGESNG